MKFFKNQNRQSTESPASDWAAMAIVNRILRLQKHLATAINRWFNGFSQKQQKWISCFFAVAIMIWLLSTLSGPFNDFSKQSKVPYSAVHIGQSSDLPTPHHGQQQFTDSLTAK
jgi:cytosine/uracil/thiamine/allantoin permease